jgi:hypothetical protein
MSERTNGAGRPATVSDAGPPLTQAIAPEFEIFGAAAVDHAAAPTLCFDLRVTESSGRDVFTIALLAQINIDPARRVYDDDTRAELFELFGEPERWGATTHSFLWAHASALVPSFAGTTEFTLPLACTYDLEVAAAKYIYSLPDWEVPLSFHFTGSVLYRGDDGELQVVLVPWTCSAQWRMPVATWKQMMQQHYPHSGFARLHADTLGRLQGYKLDRGLPSFDACVAQLLETGAATEGGG